MGLVLDVTTNNLPLAAGLAGRIPANWFGEGANSGSWAKVVLDRSPG